MKAWFLQLNQRQQRLLMALLVVVVSSFTYVGLWEPWVEASQAHRAEVAYHRATLDWLNGIESTVTQLQANQLSIGLDAGQSLLSLADQSARAAGLAGSLSRIEPVSDREVNVWLDAASFADIMAWLTRLSVERGVEVSALSVSRAGDPSQVDARIGLMISR